MPFSTQAQGHDPSGRKLAGPSAPETEDPKGEPGHGSCAARGAVLIFLSAAPLAHVFARSFKSDSGISLDAYQRIFGDSYGRLLIWNSLRLEL